MGSDILGNAKELSQGKEETGYGWWLGFPVPATSVGEGKREGRGTYPAGEDFIKGGFSLLLVVIGVGLLNVGWLGSGDPVYCVLLDGGCAP